MLNNHLKLGIEYCGLYWHSEQMGKNKNYHLMKTKKAAELGYRIIHIYEDEWINKKEVVKLRLKNILGKSEKGFGARKTKVSKISSTNANSFLNQFHLQGAGTGAFIRYGAFYNDVLIAVMTFSKPRIALGSRSDKYIELLRFSTDGRNHPGIASKIFKTFLKDFDPEMVISYADRRWSTGGLYKALGFIEKEPTKPNYWYFKPHSLKREHRFVHRKDKIKNLVENGEFKTEAEIQKELGYFKIWDCGSLKFEYRKYTCRYQQQ